MPSLFVERTVKPLHRASGPALDDRTGMIGRAAELFSTAVLDGQSVEGYEYRVNRVGGISISEVRATTRAIAARLGKVHYSVEHARPAGSVTRWDDPLTRTGRAVWVRRAPFTPHRLITTLRGAGFGYDHVVLLPTDHAAAEAVLRGADLGMVHGGEDVVRRYVTDASILPRGPVRSKILLTAEVDGRDHLDTPSSTP
ncbi:hypothetical protein [Streptomyces sp. NBC_01207]|uniref:hypothetical protein n=1 Tax=Streptomyces sp. NBC_01207 TaxID=2903772 RepID=UPI002E15490C|nr:hypothetical protein OG457_44835 [Streptomyces sp. NBC_01207]WTA23943.1 hypothetical protein OG365_38500 [Streptomyces sp. NBC_00853]